MVNNIWVKLEGGDSLTFSQAKGMSRCFEAYALHADEEEIHSMGYTKEQDVFWILLRNGVEIASTAGNRVYYTTVDEEGRVTPTEDYDIALASISNSIHPTPKVRWY